MYDDTDSSLSFGFRLLRRIGSFPSMLILVGLLLGGISACEAVSQFLQRADQIVTVPSALVAGKR